MEGHLLHLSVVLGGETKKAIERVSLSLYPLLLRRLTVHAGSLTQGCFPRTEPQQYHFEMFASAKS